jgi:hypothetical protein
MLLVSPRLAEYFSRRKSLGLGFVPGAPPSLQCIVAAFPNAMHTLSTGPACGPPRIFSMSARPVQVSIEIA